MIMIGKQQIIIKKDNTFFLSGQIIEKLLSSIYKTTLSLFLSLNFCFVCLSVLSYFQREHREKNKPTTHLTRKKMEGKEEDVKLGANKFSERQPIGTSAQTDKDYKEAPPAPLFEPGELKSWSFYRAGIAEFIATFLFLYITVLTVMGVTKPGTSKCSTVGIQGIAWAFGGMIFALVYCTAGISGNK